MGGLCRIIVVTALLAGASLGMASARAEDAPPPTVITAASSGMPLLKVSLDDAASLAITNSNTLGAQTNTADSAREAAASAWTQQLPQIGITGSTMFQSKVGQVAVPAGGTVQVGDHSNWSVGAALQWVAWDGGVIGKNAKSLKHSAESQKLSAENVRRSVLYNSRMAYFSVQLACEQLRLVAEALSVARAQYADVVQRARIGSADRLDEVTAHQDVVDRERDYQDAQRELAVQVRSFVALLGAPQEEGALFPVDARIARGAKAMPTRPDLVVNLDSLSDALALMQPRAQGQVDLTKHPAYQSSEETVRAAHFAFESARAAHWPKVTVTGQSVYQYPNFGDLSRVQQNQLTLGLSLPVIDWGMVSKQARSKQYAAGAAAEQLKEMERTLSRELAQTHDRIALLRSSRTTYAAAVKDAVEAASLVYEKYKVGTLIFLDVQRANLKALSAKIDLARIDAQLLGQLAEMESLITEDANAAE
jgi:outer membrane protein TolC